MLYLYNIKIIYSLDKIIVVIISGLNEIRTHDTAFKVPCANRYTIRPQLSSIAQITLVLILYIIFQII